MACDRTICVLGRGQQYSCSTYLVRRILFGAAAALAATSVVIALKPFRMSSGVIVSDGTGRGGGFLLDSGSCRSPIIDAWHGKEERWAIPIGSSIASSEVTTSGTVVVCRSEARHRMMLSGVALAASLVFLAVALLLARKPRADGLALSPG